MNIQLSTNPPEDLAHILGPNEKVELYIRQKMYHPRINVDYFVLTNERIILRHPHALGLKKDFTDFNYQEFSNVVLDKGIMRSTVKCVLKAGGDPLILNDLPNEDAERAFGIIRENLVRYEAPFSAAPVGIPPMRQSGVSNALACPKCGSALAMGQKFCGNCGAQV